MTFIPASPWRHEAQHVQRPYFGQRRPNYSEKLYECGWDLCVHGTILSLLNAVAIYVLSQVRKDSTLTLRYGVIRAGISTVTFLGCVEGWNHARGKNMRKMPYFSLDKIGALALSAILSPALSYGYEKFFAQRPTKFLPFLGFSLYDTAGLIMIPYI